jgi:hypothetical protein
MKKRRKNKLTEKKKQVASENKLEQKKNEIDLVLVFFEFYKTHARVKSVIAYLQFAL